MQEALTFIIWLLILIFVSFWIAGICFVPYLIVSVFVPCVPELKPLANILLKGVSLPYICSDNMVNKRGLQCDFKGF